MYCIAFVIYSHKSKVILYCHPITLSVVKQIEQIWLQSKCPYQHIFFHNCIQKVLQRDPLVALSTKKIAENVNEFSILEDAAQHVNEEDVSKHRQENPTQVQEEENLFFELNKNKNKRKQNILNDKDEEDADDDEDDDEYDDDNDKIMNVNKRKENKTKEKERKDADDDGDIDLNEVDDVSKDEQNKKQQGVLKVVKSPFQKKKKSNKSNKKKLKNTKEIKRKDKKTKSNKSGIKKSNKNDNNNNNNKNNKNNNNNNNKKAEGCNINKIKINKVKKLYIAKGSGGGKVSFVVSSKHKKKLSSNNYSHKVIGGAITKKEKFALEQNGINLKKIFAENKRIGWGTIKKPLWNKKPSMMIEDEKRFRRFMLIKELDWYKKNTVPYYGDWLDWNNFTYEENLRFFTKFSPDFNWHQVLAAFKLSRSHNS